MNSYPSEPEPQCPYSYAEASLSLWGPPALVPPSGPSLLPVGPGTDQEQTRNVCPALHSLERRLLRGLGMVLAGRERFVNLSNESQHPEVFIKLVSR